jgi:hypothetical protein
MQKRGRTETSRGGSGEELNDEKEFQPHNAEDFNLGNVLAQFANIAVGNLNRQLRFESALSFCDATIIFCASVSDQHKQAGCKRSEIDRQFTRIEHSVGRNEENHNARRNTPSHLAQGC